MHFLCFNQKTKEMMFSKKGSTVIQSFYVIKNVQTMLQVSTISPLNLITTSDFTRCYEVSSDLL